MIAEFVNVFSLCTEKALKPLCKIVDNSPFFFGFQFLSFGLTVMTTSISCPKIHLRNRGTQYLSFLETALEGIVHSTKTFQW